MAYYLQGDYYVGDYYSGDPFSIGGVFKKLGSVVGGAVGGFFRGGPVGAIAGATRAAFQPLPAQQQYIATTSPTLQVPAQVPQLTERTTFGPGGTIYKHEEYGAQLTGVSMQAGSDGCPKGFHRNKSTYYRRGQRIEKGTVCVRNRRMNVGNGKALRKAVRRSKGFVKTFRKAAGAVGYTVVAKRSPKMRKR